MRCCEDGEWQAENGIDSLAGGPCQTFYHVLVDLRDWEGGNPQTAISYVAEELLSPPEVHQQSEPDIQFGTRFRQPADCHQLCGGGAAVTPRGAPHTLAPDPGLF